MTVRNHDIIEVTLHVHHETDKAFLVSEDDETKLWVPKSQCEKEDKVSGNVFNFQMPEWLAKEKGFI